jgi:8-oxo-dGTP diphosphatase/2-hydroxy-dATP diphosphatase
VEKPILMEVHVFTTNEFTGEPLESEGILNDKCGLNFNSKFDELFSIFKLIYEEMIPKWYSIEDLPEQMWPDVKLWFPLFVKGSKFSGHFKVINESKIDKFVLNEITDDSIIKPIDCLD